MAARLRLFASNHVRLLASLGVLAAGVLVFALVADRSPVGVRAAAWAATHTSSLPQTLDDLAAYPPDYRREIFKALPAETQSALWRTQLRQFAADRPNLTTGQREFVNYVIDLVSPESFQPGANPPELCERVAKMFPNKEDRESFSKISEGVTPTFAWQPAMLTLTERVREKVFASAQRSGGDCNCRGAGFCECSAFEACYAADCNQVEECGCIFLGNCNRQCEFILEGAASINRRR